MVGTEDSFGGNGIDADGSGALAGTGTGAAGAGAGAGATCAGAAARPSGWGPALAGGRAGAGGRGWAVAIGGGCDGGGGLVGGAVVFVGVVSATVGMTGGGALVVGGGGPASPDWLGLVTGPAVPPGLPCPTTKVNPRMIATITTRAAPAPRVQTSGSRLGSRPLGVAPPGSGSCPEPAAGPVPGGSSVGPCAGGVSDGRGGSP
jgi:hypothetical protein